MKIKHRAKTQQLDIDYAVNEGKFLVPISPTINSQFQSCALKPLCISDVSDSPAAAASSSSSASSSAPAAPAAAPAAAAASKKKSKPASETASSHSHHHAHETAVQRFSREVLDEVFKSLRKQQSHADGSSGAHAHAHDEAALRAVLTPNVEDILNRLQNAAYTDGFVAAKTPVRSHMFKP